MEKTVTVKWPFEQDENGGFDSFSERDFVEAVKFSIKNILLTNPGEKISDPQFGIGLRRYLFSLSTEDFSSLQGEITFQIRKYLPYLTRFNVSIDLTQVDYNKLAVRVSFEIVPKEIKDFLDVVVSV
jgi:phage baseplate assembly protein W